MRRAILTSCRTCLREQWDGWRAAGSVLAAASMTPSPPPLLQQQQQQQPFAAGSSGPSSGGPWHCLVAVRHMAGRTHKLSLKKQNNRASWLAVQPFLERLQGDVQAQQQLGPVIDTALPPLPPLPEPPLHQKIGRITGPYAVQPQDCFAVIESGGSQFKVTADDVIYHNKIPGARVNDVLEFRKVLLLGGVADTTIGRPFIPGASVVAAVEETFKDAKVWVFKKKKRKRYSKLHGHRSHITALRVLEVRQPTQEQVEAATAALEAAARGGWEAGLEEVPAAAALEAALAAAATAADAAAPGGGGGGGGAGTASSGVLEADAPSPAGGEKQQQQQQHGRPARLPLRLVGAGQRHGPPAVTNVWSIAPPPARGGGSSS